MNACFSLRDIFDGMGVLKFDNSIEIELEFSMDPFSL